MPLTLAQRAQVVQRRLGPEGDDPGVRVEFTEDVKHRLENIPHDGISLG